MYDQILTSLRESYNSRVAEREKTEIDPWKLIESQHFLDVIQG